MEGATLVVEGLARLALSLLSRAKGAKIFYSFGDGITEQTHDDTPTFSILDIDIKEDLGRDLF